MWEVRSLDPPVLQQLKQKAKFSQTCANATSVIYKDHVITYISLLPIYIFQVLVMKASLLFYNIHFSAKASRGFTVGQLYYA